MLYQNVQTQIADQSSMLSVRVESYSLSYLCTLSSIKNRQTFWNRKAIVKFQFDNNCFDSSSKKLSSLLILLLSYATTVLLKVFEFERLLSKLHAICVDSQRNKYSRTAFIVLSKDEGSFVKLAAGPFLVFWRNVIIMINYDYLLSVTLENPRTLTAGFLICNLGLASADFFLN